MATFHPFPRLPLELRIQIWRCATEDRVLRVKPVYRARHEDDCSCYEGYLARHEDDYSFDEDFCSCYEGYWSPAPIPAVTRACWESRKHSSYRKAFTLDSSSRYIWTNFDRDIIYTKSLVVFPMLNGSVCGKNEVRHLRIEPDPGEFLPCCFRRLGEFPRLETVDLLTNFKVVSYWDSMSQFIKSEDLLWGPCPPGYVRVVDGNTGEWIDENTRDAYQEYVKNGGKMDDERPRKYIQMPLPRISLDYDGTDFRAVQ